MVNIDTQHARLYTTDYWCVTALVRLFFKELYIYVGTFKMGYH